MSSVHSPSAMIARLVFSGIAFNVAAANRGALDYMEGMVTWTR